MTQEVIYSDTSTSTFHGDGGSFHEGPLAMERLRLITARSALAFYIKWNGKAQLTRNGAQMAVKNVIEPLTGKEYKRSMKGKQEALADCEYLIWAIENNAVVYEED